MFSRLALLIRSSCASNAGFAKAAASRRVVAQFDRTLGEIILEDQVDDALVGGIAITQRDFFGQHFHPPDRLGRNIAHLTEAGDALAVDQQDRKAPAPSAPAAGLRADCADQVGQRGDPIGGDVFLVESHQPALAARRPGRAGAWRRPGSHHPDAAFHRPPARLAGPAQQPAGHWRKRATAPRAAERATNAKDGTPQKATEHRFGFSANHPVRLGLRNDNAVPGNKLSRIGNAGRHPARE